MDCTLVLLSARARYPFVIMNTTVLCVGRGTPESTLVRIETVAGSARPDQRKISRALVGESVKILQNTPSAQTYTSAGRISGRAIADDTEGQTA